MEQRQGPLMAVVAEPEGVSVEELEEDFLREALDFAGRWLRQLPASSRWHGTVQTLHRVSAEALGRRRARLAGLR